MPSNRIYIGKLGEYIRKFDLVQVFAAYGQSNLFKLVDNIFNFFYNSHWLASDGRLCICRVRELQFSSESLIGTAKCFSSRAVVAIRGSMELNWLVKYKM